MSDHSSAALALSVVALVPSIYGTCLPPVAVVRELPDAGGHQGEALRSATITAAVVVVAAAAMLREPVVLVAGGAAVALQWAAYARAVPSPLAPA